MSEIKETLHELLPDADEISFSYFKSNDCWAMWASKNVLVEKDNGERILETTIFAREDGKTPLDAIQKHLNKTEET